MADFQALKLLRALDEGVNAKTGEAFFPHLVSSLAQTLNASCAFVSEITRETYEARALAYWCNGEFGATFQYDLSGTPCECVLDNEIVAFPRNIQEMFPKDRDWFASIGVHSFLAIPLSDEQGTILGHLAVLDRRERDWGEVDFEIIRIFSMRAGAELGRREYEKRLEAANVALQKANAQLRREVAQRLQTEDALQTSRGNTDRVADLVRVLNTGITSKTGTEFFQELVRSLATALEATTVFVAQINAEKYEADILAIWVGGAFGQPVSFNLTGSPCETVLDGQISAFPRRVAELFPAVKPIIEQLGTRSYLAIPIVDDTQGVIGHIAVQDVRERDWSETDFGILRLFANRAGAELKRRDHERNLENTTAQYQKANAALRREVASRLHMEDQLAKAKRTAEEANQAKSNFLAHMSHELRTPLNGVLGYAQLLKRDPTLGPDQLESVAVIEHSGEHLLTLINDLLDLAKIEAGRVDLHWSLIDLNPLLKHVASLTEVRAAQAGLTFACRLSADLPRQVRADERALRQVLLNLLGNAVKFTQQGNVTFDASSAQTAEGRCRVTFRIQDSGQGIAPENLQRIFEPFVRATQDTRIEGTGLGLAITKRLLAAMGGQIEVESQLGMGSSFTVTLDFDLESTRTAPAGIQHRIIGYEGRQRRILIVDNDATNRRLIARMFAAVGFKTLEAQDGAEALQAARSERPDLIVTDLAMPVMTGIELARKVRDDSDLQAVPLIAVSASASIFSRDEAITAGCNHFLAKPVRAEELFTLAGQTLALAWRTAEDPVGDRGRLEGGSIEACSVEGITVAAQWATQLYDLAMRGDVKDLLAAANNAAAKDPHGAPVYQEVQRLARTFDMKGIRRVLQAARADQR